MITSKLTERITILKGIISGGTLGEPKTIWEPLQTVFASIMDQRGTTNFSDLPGNTYRDHLTFWLRYNPNLDKKGNRILYNCQDYRITSMKHVQRNQATVIEVETVE